MKNAGKPAYPRPGFTVGGKGHKNYSEAGFTSTKQDGLTKREAFAMAAMQGILSNPSFHEDLRRVTPNNENPALIIAEKSIALADTILIELEQTKSPKP